MESQKNDEQIISIIRHYLSCDKQKHFEIGQNLKFYIFRKAPLTFALVGKDAIFVADNFLNSLELIREIFVSENSKYRFQTILFPRFFSFYKQALNKNPIEIYEKKSSEWTIIASGTESANQKLDEFLKSFFVPKNSFNKTIGIDFSENDGLIKFGVALIDTNKQICRFADFSDSKLLCELESLIISQNPKEAILPTKCKNSFLLEKIRSLLTNCGVVVTLSNFVTKSPENENSALNQISKMADISYNLASNFVKSGEQSLSLIAFYSTYKYLDLNGFLFPSENRFNDIEITKNVKTENGILKNEKWKMKKIGIENQFRMNKGAIEAMNLFSFGHKNSKFVLKQKSPKSIFELLNKTKTANGAKLLKRFLLQPLFDKSKIEKRLQIVQFLLENGKERIKIQNVLKKVPNIDNLRKKLIIGTCNVQDLVALYDFSKTTIPEMASVLNFKENLSFVEKSAISSLKMDVQSPLQKTQNKLSKFEQMIEKVIDLESVKNHDYRINPKFTESIFNMATEINNLKEEMENEKLIILKKSNLKIKIDKVFPFGFHFVSPKNSAKILKKIQIQILKTQKSLIRFTTTKFAILSKKHEKAISQYEKECCNIISECVKISSSYAHLFEYSSDVIAFLDVMASFSEAAASPFPSSKFSNSHIYVKPEILPPSQNRMIRMRQGRHPLLDCSLDREVIANDVEMNQNSILQIITGPNMGGKSTYLKQVAAIQLMAQIGSFVPCEEIEINLVKSIFARVGAADSQSKGISTFMSEMNEMAVILKAANKDSLVIIDELGRGTSTIDGLAISRAISEQIVEEKKCFCLFATHFHEMANLESTYPNLVKNKHFAAKITSDEFKLTHKINNGSSDHSYGIQVASMTNFPQNVIDLAKRKLIELEKLNFGKTFQIKNKFIN